jgi:hypothetical protein
LSSVRCGSKPAAGHSIRHSDVGEQRLIVFHVPKRRATIGGCGAANSYPFAKSLRDIAPP